MIPVNITELRASMAAHFDRVKADRTELVVTRQNHEPMVILALSGWQGMLETLHVLSTRANADHVRRSVRSYEEGRTIERDLVKPRGFSSRRKPGPTIRCGWRPTVPRSAGSTC